jgi:hypothetical protein
MELATGFGTFAFLFLLTKIFASFSFYRLIMCNHLILHYIKVEMFVFVLVRKRLRRAVNCGKCFQGKKQKRQMSSSLADWEQMFWQLALLAVAN